MILFQADKGSLEGKVRERDSEIQSLRLMLKEVQATPTKPVTIETSVQTTPPSQERAQVDASVQATPPSQQGIDTSIQAEHVREAELRLKREELQVERTERENGKLKDSVPPEAAKIAADHGLAGVKKAAATRSQRTSVGAERSLPFSTAPQNSSLESEMRVAGVEVTDPYDSSEGVGFSDSCNFDEVPDSMHSLDSFKSKEGSTPVITSLGHEQRVPLNSDSAVPVASLVVDQQPSSTVVKQHTAGGVATNLDLQEEDSSERMTSSSDGDLQPHNQGTCTRI